MRDQVHLLLVEDDSSFGYILKTYLEMHDLNVHWVTDGKTALTSIEQLPFDLCILDIMLPDIDGFEIAQRIKERNPELPFIFLTAKSLKVDKLAGYQLGCDEYITKPMDDELLLAKIQAILKRVKSPNGAVPDKQYDIGKYVFNYSMHTLTSAGHQHKLTNKEADLLKLLCDHKNALVSRERALKTVWGKNDIFNRKTMDVFIYKLRKYFASDPGIRIANVHGKGFVLEAL